jgi:predicted transcriptional regulator of viral defense system
MPLAMKVQIRARIERFGPGKVFMAKDFLDIASRGSIDVALGSLTRAGEIRRIRRGLYDLPRVSAALGGELSPDIDQAARALARRNSMDHRTRWTMGCEPAGPFNAGSR